MTGVSNIAGAALNDVARNRAVASPPSIASVKGYLQAQFGNRLILRNFPDYAEENAPSIAAGASPDLLPTGATCLMLARPSFEAPLAVKLLSATRDQNIELCNPDFLPYSAALPSADVMPDNLCLLLHAIAEAGLMERPGVPSGIVSGYDIRLLFDNIVAFEQTGQKGGMPALQYAQCEDLRHEPLAKRQMTTETHA